MAVQSDSKLLQPDLLQLSYVCEFEDWSTDLIITHVLHEYDWLCKGLHRWSYSWSSSLDAACLALSYSAYKHVFWYLASMAIISPTESLASKFVSWRSWHIFTHSCPTAWWLLHHVSLHKQEACHRKTCELCRLWTNMSRSHVDSWTTTVHLLQKC